MHSLNKPSSNPTKASPILTGPLGQPLTGHTSSPNLAPLTTGQPLTGQPLPGQHAPLPPHPNPEAHPKPDHPPPGPSQVKPTPWIDLLKSSSPRMELNFLKPSINDRGFLALGEGTSKEGETFWKNTLVGYSIDRRLPFKLVHQRLLMLWGKYGIRDIRVNKEGFYFFTFISDEGAHRVLSGGPWVVLGQQLYLKAWKRNFDFCKEEFKTIPNWVKLYGIPTTYWSSSGLSAIASHIGVPLYTDELTSSAKLLDFARICVEMKVGSDFPASFKVQTEFDEEFEVRVEYSWRPRQCSLCNVFGHSTLSCPKNPVQATKDRATTAPRKPAQIYRPKPQALAEPPPCPNHTIVPTSPPLPVATLSEDPPPIESSSKVLATLEDGDLVEVQCSSSYLATANKNILLIPVPSPSSARMW